MEIERKNSIDDEWDTFINLTKTNGGRINNSRACTNSDTIKTYSKTDISNIKYTPSELYISTKTKLIYLVTPIDLSIFWDIPIIDYISPVEGIIQKQTKFTTFTREAFDELQCKLPKDKYYTEYVITHKDDQNSVKLKFKDIRKISIGLSSKDIINFHSRPKQAFYNCIVLIIRVKSDGDNFKEFHVKLFNTGKIEIPGACNEKLYISAVTILLNMLTSVLGTTPQLKQSCDDINCINIGGTNVYLDNILTNSDFNCGFCINRDALNYILNNKYNIHAIYDPCSSYQGIKCKFYYDPTVTIQTGCYDKDNSHLIQVTVMIFRTGSVIIVGKCNELVNITVYKFIRDLFETEMSSIYHSTLDIAKIKKIKQDKVIKLSISTVQ